MGETQMGRFSVLASWPIHMAFIILFSNMWSILFHEWKGTSGRTWGLLTTGLAALVVSTLISSYGSWLQENQASPATTFQWTGSGELASTMQNVSRTDLGSSW